MSWLLKEQLQHILAKEQGATVFPPGSRSPMALVYPNTYHVGMSNLGLHVMYQQINQRGDTACERFFLPEGKTREEYVRTHTPLLSLETQRPLYDFPVVAFAVSFEMDYFHLLDILSLGRIPLLAADRNEKHPFVMIGGPCATFNPEPLADFVDLCIIGEGEEVIHEVLDAYYDGMERGLTRKELLLRLAQLQGVYAPAFYHPVYNADGLISSIQSPPSVPDRVRRRYIKDLDQYPAQTVIVTENTEFKDMFLLEVARGCGRHCRFCMAGYCFRRPRGRSLIQLASAIEEAGKYRTKVGLVGAAISDYLQIDELCHIIRNKGMDLSVASLRADSLTPVLAEALAASGHRTMTLAPEAGSDRLRRIINKTLTEEDLLQAVSMAVSAGIPHFRLYIMAGLPEETEEDIEAVIQLALTMKNHMLALGSKGKLTLSINPFVPKPFTPFQWTPMADYDLIVNRLKRIQQALRTVKGIELLLESPKESCIQGVLARGDRRLGPVLLSAMNKGGGAKGWKQALKMHGIQESFYLHRERKENEIFPWETIDIGVDRKYLLAEYHRAKQETTTFPCIDGCKRCGVCSK